MNPNAIAFLVLLAISVGAGVLVFGFVRLSLHDLLQRTIKLPAGVTFYIRSLLVVLCLSVLSAAIGTTFDLKPGSRFMEYVWKVAEGFSSAFEKLLWFIAIYVVLITILIATLKITNDE